MGICRRMRSVGFLNGLGVVMFAIPPGVDLDEYASRSRVCLGGHGGRHNFALSLCCAYTFHLIFARERPMSYTRFLRTETTCI